MTDPVKSLDLSNILRHAFLAGRGLDMGATAVKLSDADLAAWTEYDPTKVRPYVRIFDALYGSGSKATPEEKLAGEIMAELIHARTKFPGTNATLAALVEEVGEVSTALMEEPRANVRKEAIQVAVMAIRIILDGDQTLDEWRRSKGLDPLIPA